GHRAADVRSARVALLDAGRVLGQAGDDVAVAVVDRLVVGDDLAAGPTGGPAALAQRAADGAEAGLGDLDVRAVPLVHRTLLGPVRGDVDRAPVVAREAVVAGGPDLGAVLGERRAALR